MAKGKAVQFLGYNIRTKNETFFRITGAKFEPTYGVGTELMNSDEVIALLEQRGDEVTKAIQPTTDEIRTVITSAHGHKRAHTYVNAYVSGSQYEYYRTMSPKEFYAARARRQRVDRALSAALSEVSARYGNTRRKKR